MALNTTYLVALLALGFFMLFLGWPWWMGIGLILVVMASAVNDEVAGPEEMPERFIDRQPVRAAPARPSPGAILSKITKAAETGGVEDIKWSPSAIADGILGINSMKGDFGGSVGSRSGAFTQDMGPIRFKDDIRFRLTAAGESAAEIADAKAFDMCLSEVPDGMGPLHAWDFRTRKDFFPGLHTASVKTVTSPDYMLDPGLGIPWKKDKNKR
jgi:hypothetical protein